MDVRRRSRRLIIFFFPFSGYGLVGDISNLYLCSKDNLLKVNDSFTLHRI